MDVAKEKGLKSQILPHEETRKKKSIKLDKSRNVCTELPATVKPTMAKILGKKTQEVKPHILLQILKLYIKGD